MSHSIYRPPEGRDEKYPDTIPGWSQKISHVAVLVRK